MYAQLFLGIWMLINAITHLLKLNIFLKKSIISSLSDDELASYHKGCVLPFFLLGILFISMAFVEVNKLLSTPLFIIVYIIFASVPSFLFLRNNKKHSGFYFF